MYLALDDTDSSTGGCTTHLALCLIEALRPYGDLIEYPALVRLNPCCPSKTRGNGAILLRFGNGTPVCQIGSCTDGKPIILCQAKTPLDTTPSILQIIDRVIQEHRAETSNTGMIVFDRTIEPSWYHQIVTTLLSRDQLMLDQSMIVRSYGSGEGLIGCIGALGWDRQRCSFELIAYRERFRWGTKRLIDRSAFRASIDQLPGEFRNKDSKRLAAIPNTPCPILFGVRSWRSDLLPFLTLMQSQTEPIVGALIFQTNHGSDDHILAPIEPLEEHRSYRICGTLERIELRPGRHRLLDLRTETGLLRVAVYAQTGKLAREIIRLIPGDQLECFGSFLRGQLNLEKARILSLRIPLIKCSNPICQACKLRMRSHGVGGYRCSGCHLKLPKSAASFEQTTRPMIPEAFDCSAGSARHLSRPVFLYDQS